MTPPVARQASAARSRLRAAAAPAAVAVACYGVALLLAGPPAADPADVVRALARPFALPAVWRAMRDAEVRGSPGEWVAHGRTLVRMLPEWTDAHVHVAWRLAFDEGMRAGKDDPQAALARLLAALAMLEQALGRGPAADAEVLGGMATIVQIRARQDEGLAAAFRERIGDEPAAVADRYLQRAEQRLPSRALADRRTILLVDLVAGALRSGDVRRALATLELALERVEQLRDPDLAARWRQALQRLHRWLAAETAGAAGPTRESLDALATDPMLDRIVEALRAAGYR